jgi:hypothetical protein
LCTGGAQAMFGARQGFCARMKEVNLQVDIFRCLLHKENLASRRLSEGLIIMMKEAIQVENFIKVLFLNNRIFIQVCSDNYFIFLRSGGHHEETFFNEL